MNNLKKLMYLKFNFNKLFSFIYKQKSKASFVLLLSVFLAGVLLPTITLAAAPQLDGPFESDLEAGTTYTNLVIVGSGFLPTSQLYVNGVVAPPGTYHVDSPTIMRFGRSYSSGASIDETVWVQNGDERSPQTIILHIRGAWWQNLFSAVNNVTAGILPNVTIAVVMGTTKLLSVVSFQVAKFASGVFTTVLTEFTKNSNTWSITSNASDAGVAFIGAWNLVKNWANMLILLGVIGVALATILRWPPEYDARKLLLPLIIVALLVNFSIVFIGIMIDTSNLVMTNLAKGGAKEADLVLMIDKVREGGVRQLGDTVKDLPTALLYAGLENIFTVIYILISITLFWLALILIERYIMLAILFILSPLAFVFRVFPMPKARDLWNKWWQDFIKYCFLGVAAIFFLRLSVSMLSLSSFTDSLTLIVPGGAGVGKGSADLIANMMPSLIFHLLIVLGFLVAGLKIAKKSSGPISNAIISGVKAAAGMAVTGGVAVATGGASLASTAAGAAVGGTVGAGKGVVGGTVGTYQGIKQGGTLKEKVVGGLGGIGSGIMGTARESLAGGVKGGVQGLGVTGDIKRAASNIRERIAGGLESIGAITPGTQESLKQQRFAIDPERKKKLDLATPQQIESLATGNASNQTEINDKVYAIQKLAEKGMKGVPAQERERLMKYGTDSGLSEDIFLKADPELAEHATKSKAELIRTGRAKEQKDASGTVIRTADQDAINILQKQNYLQYKTDVPINDKDRIESVRQKLIDPSTGKIDPAKRVGAHESKIIDEMAKDGTLGKLSKALGGLSNLATQINHTTEDFGSNARKGLIKIAPHKADELDKEAVDELKAKINPATPGINWTDTDAKREVRRKANSRVEARGIKDLSDETFSSVPDTHGNIAGMEFINDTTVKKLQKADNLSKEQINMLQELAKKGKRGGVYVGEINKAIEAARTAGDNKKADELIEKRRAIRALI